MGAIKSGLKWNGNNKRYQFTVVKRFGTFCCLFIKFALLPKTIWYNKMMRRKNATAAIATEIKIAKNAYNVFAMDI